MTPEELAAERAASRKRQQAKRDAEPPHEKQKYRLGHIDIRKGFFRKMGEDEYTYRVTTPWK